MTEKYMPDIYQKSIYYINYDKLYKKGVRCILFDLDNTTVMKSTRNYLKKATKEKRVITVSYELPKSFIVTDENDYSVYISQFLPSTLANRANKTNWFIKNIYGYMPVNKGEF